MNCRKIYIDTFYAFLALSSQITLFYSNKVACLPTADNIQSNPNNPKDQNKMYINSLLYKNKPRSSVGSVLHKDSFPIECENVEVEGQNASGQASKKEDEVDCKNEQDRRIKNDDDTNDYFHVKKSIF